MSPEEHDEKLLEEYLEGNSELSRLYRRGADEQPAERLDERILAEARRAVSTRKRVVHSPFARHWLVPTSLAAVLVLSLGVVLLMPAPEPVLDDGLEAPAQSEPAARDAPVETERLRLRRQASEGDEEVAGERAFEAAPRSSPSVDRQLDTAAGKAEEQRRATSGSAADGAQAPRPSAPVSGRASAASAPAKTSAAARPEPMPSEAVRAEPRAWLGFIEKLLAERDRDGALSNLRAFRARYPDYPLPPELAPLAASLESQSR